MGIRLGQATALDRQEVADTAVRPYRDAMRFALREIDCAFNGVVDPYEALAEVERVAKSALGPEVVR